MSAMSPGWRLAARLARREVRRRPWRNALVVALVAVPVGAMLVMIGTLRVGELTAHERWTFNYGAADGVSFADRPPGGLPAGSRVLTYRTTTGSLATPAGAGCSCTLTDVPLYDAVTTGAARLTSGRYPRQPGELMLSSSAAKELDLRVGDAVDVDAPIVRSGRVVGIGRVRATWREPTVVLAPGSLTSGSITHLVDLPAGLTARELREVFTSEDGPSPSPSPSIALDVPRYDFTSENNNGDVRWTLLGGAAWLTVVGIVIVAAFAVSARRQLVTLGQLAANGAEPATLRRVLFLQGTIAGVAGSAVGLGLGTLVLNVGRRWFVRLTLQDLAGWHVRWTDVLPIAGLGVLAATVAALIPARKVPRIPVLMALAGRRPEGQVSRRAVAGGLAASCAGLGLMALGAYLGRGGANPGLWGWAGAVGVVLLFVGVCAAAPVVTAVLDLLAVRLRGPWRLAARTLSRQRTRTSAVVAAIAVTSAAAVAAAALLVGLKEERRSEQVAAYDQVVRLMADHPPSPEIVARVAQVLPDATSFRLSDAVTPGGIGLASAHDGDQVRHLVVADEQFAEAFGLSDDTRRLLDDSGVLVLGVQGGPTVVRMLGQSDETLVELDAVEVGPHRAAELWGVGGIFITPAKLRSSGLHAVPGDVVLRNPEPFTGAQLDRLDGLRGPALPSVTLLYTRPVWYLEDGVMEGAAAGVALLLALFVVGAMLGLSGAESRDERHLLAAVGAAPRTLRRASARKAVLLTLLGGLLAVPVGYLPVVVLTRADGATGMPLVFPWRAVALLVVGVPLVVGLLTRFGSGLGRRWRPLEVAGLSAD